MKILANRMDLGFQKHQSEFETAALRVLQSGWYIMGKEMKSFESEFAKFNEDTEHTHPMIFTGNGNERIYCAGVASGLDALWIGMKSLGIGAGDDFIVQGNTYIASVMGGTINGATPIFVEPDESYQINVDKIESAITINTKAIMIVHLYGMVCNMDKVIDICKRHNLYLVEDCAQAHGAMWNGQRVGTFGDVGCFSFYPTKNLGAFGDAGAVISHNPETIHKIEVFRNYGSQEHYKNEVVGANSRLDEIQAALLKVKLKYFDEITSERRRLARRYDNEIMNNKIIKPKEIEGSFSVYHQYVIRCEERDELVNYLKEKEISSIIHYPIPPHLQEAYKYLGHTVGEFPITERYANEVLSIPMYNGMSDEEQKYVIDVLNDFS